LKGLGPKKSSSNNVIFGRRKSAGAEPQAVFRSFDRNGDGHINRAELSQALRSESFKVGNPRNGQWWGSARWRLG